MYVLFLPTKHYYNILINLLIAGDIKLIIYPSTKVITHSHKEERKYFFHSIIGKIYIYEFYLSYRYVMYMITKELICKLF